VLRDSKCINVTGGYVENYMFLQVRISHVSRFIILYDLLTLPRNISPLSNVKLNEEFPFPALRISAPL
jgi:hypothetical protein